ncbi:MAG: alpha/beta hydrolase [Nitrososphaeraceae archaeon]
MPTKKSDVMKIWKTTENLSRLLDQSRLLRCKVAIVSALIVMLLVTSSIVLHQQQITAQKQKQSVSNQTAFNIENPVEDLSFEMDNMTFSHHKATVNGIQMHYVIGGQGDPVVLLHGWPQTWYEWHHVMPALAKNYTVVAPDLRGLGDSSKPFSGYDGNTTAEDIYQLMTQLGIKQKINLVGHDIGVQTAYSYAAIHPDNVSKLVILDVPVLGILPIKTDSRLWHIPFHQVPDIPEFLVEGKERDYLSMFYKVWAYNPEAIAEADIDEYVSHYSAPGGMRAGFEYYRSFSIEEEQNKEFSKIKLQMPVLALGGEYSFGTAALESMKLLATNVSGGTVPFSGHWIAEERPDFLIKELAKFFSE